VYFTKDNKVTVQKSKLVILAIKPKIMPFVLDELNPLITEDHLVISFVAGVHLSSIEKVPRHLYTTLNTFLQHLLYSIQLYNCRNCLCCAV